MQVYKQTIFDRDLAFRQRWPDLGKNRLDPIERPTLRLWELQKYRRRLGLRDLVYDEVIESTKDVDENDNWQNEIDEALDEHYIDIALSAEED